MKSSKVIFLNLIFTITLLMSLSVSAQTTTTATTPPVDPNIDPIVAQQTACTSNVSQEWSTSLNRCVSKVEAIKMRTDAEACNAIADLPQREACHKTLAENNSGLSSDPTKLNQGRTTESMIMNGAYSIVALINLTGSGSVKSSCTSKTIFGVTALAGLASDAYLKYMANKKVKALAGKYKLDVTNSASDAQVKALQYLREEQQTVVQIASLEKKRNILLMLGYGAAGVMAAVELAIPTMNPECNKPDEKPADTAPPVETSPPVVQSNFKIDNFFATSLIGTYKT